MKKFVTVLVIITALGLGVFSAGWIQLPVPQGSYGVLRSKTHGVYDKVIESGKFTWLWYRLIPTNTEIAVFDINNQTVEIETEDDLPQADIYASFVGLKTDFSWQVSGIASFSVNAELLPRLAREYGISNQSRLDAYTEGLCSRLAPFIKQRLSYYCAQRDGIEEINSEGRYKKLQDDISAAFPYITGVSCALNVKKIPDFDMYESAKSLYDDYIAHQREVLNRVVKENAAERIKSQFRLDELTRYGALLTEYPIILEYLKIKPDDGG
jgi:hypothetical protein